jgi:hypothetical protein
VSSKHRLFILLSILAFSAVLLATSSQIYAVLGEEYVYEVEDDDRVELPPDDETDPRIGDLSGASLVLVTERVELLYAPEPGAGTGSFLTSGQTVFVLSIVNGYAEVAWAGEVLYIPASAIGGL